MLKNNSTKIFVFILTVAILGSLFISSLIARQECEYNFCCKDSDPGGGENKISILTILREDDCANTKGCDGYSFRQYGCDRIECYDEYNNKTDDSKCHRVVD